MDNSYNTNCFRHICANKWSKMKIKIEDVLFWIIILLIIGVAIWKLIGSPTDTAALISITLFIAGSEILLWRAIFSIEGKTSVGFERIKNDLDKQQMNLNFKLDKVNENMNKIENLILKNRISNK